MRSSCLFVREHNARKRRRKNQKTEHLPPQKSRSTGGVVDCRGNDAARSEKGAGVDSGAHGGAVGDYAGRRIEAREAKRPVALDIEKERRGDGRAPLAGGRISRPRPGRAHGYCGG